MAFFSFYLTLAIVVAVARSFRLTDCVGRALWCMSYTSTQDGRDGCRYAFDDCSDCTIREISCRTVAKKNTAADLQCTVDAQHCFTQIDCRYSCEDALHTCLGGLNTEHCVRQKQICDACALQEDDCRYGPGHPHQQIDCTLAARWCNWNATSLNQTIATNVTCEPLWPFYGPLCDGPCSC